MKFIVGTSGYSYPKWKGSFYPPKLPQKEMLTYYAERFAAVEINNSFYRMPATDVLKSWAKQVPESFQFAFKAPQTITHFKRLKDADEPTKQFLKAIAVMKSHRGPLLFGLPPNFKKDLPRLKSFLKLLRGRHASPLSSGTRAGSTTRCSIAFPLSAVHCASPTKTNRHLPISSAQPVGATSASAVRTIRTETFAWVKRIKSQPWDEVFVFFKHEDTGTGPRFARGSANWR